MAPHTGSATPEQITALLNFLVDHKDLAHGRMRSVEAKVQAKRLWEEVCNMLNSMGGCTKTIQQWQKVWSDRKHLAKKAAADSRRAASATGGGPSTTPPLSQWELKVLEIMGDGFGDRQTGARVPAFGEINEISSQASLPPSFSQPLRPEMAYVEPTQDNGISQHSVPESSRRSSQPARRRRQTSASQTSSVRSRLFQIEEERAERETIRNNELAGIRAALVELCEILLGNFNKE